MRLAWLDGAEQDLIDNELEPNNCSYCGTRIPMHVPGVRRTLVTPVMPVIVGDSADNWKPIDDRLEQGSMHWLVNTCPDCEAMLKRSNGPDSYPVPASVVKFLLSCIKSWKIFEYGGDNDGS